MSDLEVGMQQWFVWAWIFAMFAIVIVVVLRNLIKGNTSQGPSGGAHNPIYDGASGTTTSDCGSSSGGDGGACGTSGGSS